MNPIAYSFTFILMALCYLSLLLGGVWSWIPPLFIFGVVPLLETMPRLARAQRNLEAAEEARQARRVIYDDLLVLAIVLHVALVVMLLLKARQAGSIAELSSAIIATGLACGIYGINVAHELGHRPDKLSRFWARLGLYSSLYSHFMIEHNLGHHRNVATPEDPASARQGEGLYAFWVRSISMSYVSAWRIMLRRLRERGHGFWSLQNTLLLDHLAQASLLAAIWLFLGNTALLAFALAALLGILLLETVNYIEHYGLVRQRQGQRYESVKPAHSWNSNHLIGRLVLFNLPRHSDHHARASRKYQVLRHFEESPQLPAGYPAMLILALAPPLWRRVMG
ncbi:MAG: alkane 1-monooxygenase [Spirochaetales bacterium]|nr:alkane 1-monooxygenase [Spirochaetales bacterium]